MDTNRTPSRSRRVRATIGVTSLALGVVLASPSAQVAPLPPSSPFDVIGFIQDATVDAPNDPFSGGTITVHGTKIVVPRNTLLQMPAATLTWQEVFAKAPAPYGVKTDGTAQSGLALHDVPTPVGSYEVRVMGNRVVTATDDRHIAGLVFLSQHSLNAGAGFINYIDYANGELRVGGRLNDPNDGARVRINDPIGRYGRAGSPDVRFSIDEDSPTVRTETGFPMCLPRTLSPADDDPACPQRNRPKYPGAGFLMVVNFKDPFNLKPTDPDARLMMPFEVGDYITYNGNLYRESGGQAYVSAYAITANVGAFTAPGSRPAYVAIDVIVVGVGGYPQPGMPQEAFARTRVEGFTTDPTNPIMISGIDVDPCSGATYDRYYGLAFVDGGPPLGAVRGRWRWRPISLEGDFLPPTREVRAESFTGVVDVPVANGLYAGQYHAPTFEFLPPENRGIGNPPIPMNFQDFPFLAEGSGPYPADESPGRIGQLSPWPGAQVPSPVVCGSNGTTFRAPIADAGVSQQAGSGDVVSLDGLASADSPYNDPQLSLSYSWTQVSGPPVVLVGANSPMPSFKAPMVADGAPSQTLVFALTVRNIPANLTSTVNTTVTVSATAEPVDVLDVPVATFRMRRSLLTVTATSSNPRAVLTLKGFGIMQPTNPAVPGRYQLAMVGVSLMMLPNEVTITSSLGGSITVPVSFIP